MRNKEYDVLKLRTHHNNSVLTVPKFALKQFEGVKTFQVFIRDGLLCYKPVDLESLAK